MQKGDTSLSIRKSFVTGLRTHNYISFFPVTLGDTHRHNPPGSHPSIFQSKVCYRLNSAQGSAISLHPSPQQCKGWEHLQKPVKEFEISDLAQRTGGLCNFRYPAVPLQAKHFPPKQLLSTGKQRPPLPDLSGAGVSSTKANTTCRNQPGWCKLHHLPCLSNLPVLTTSIPYGVQRDSIEVLPNSPSQKP